MDLHTLGPRLPLRRLSFRFSQKSCTLNHDGGMGAKDEVHNAPNTPTKAKGKKQGVIEGFAFLDKI